MRHLILLSFFFFFLLIAPAAVPQQSNDNTSIEIGVGKHHIGFYIKINNSNTYDIPVNYTIYYKSFHTNRTIYNVTFSQILPPGFVIVHTYSPIFLTLKRVKVYIHVEAGDKVADKSGIIFICFVRFFN